MTGPVGSGGANFIDAFNQYIASDGGLNDTELQDLVDRVIAGDLDETAIAGLREALTSESSQNGSGLSVDEKRFLHAIGHATTDAAVVQQVREHTSTPTSTAIGNLFERGFRERERSETAYRDANPGTAAVRDAAADLANSVTQSATGKAVLGAFGISAETARVNTTAQASAAQDTAGVVAGTKGGQALRDSAQATDCIRHGLESVAAANSDINITRPVNFTRVTEQNLESVTNTQWDAINLTMYAKDNDGLRGLLEGKEGQALVTMGAHVFVFQGFDDAGNLRVTDPSSQDPTHETTIDSRTAHTATVYVPGDGDGTRTGQAHEFGYVRKFDENNPSKGAIGLRHQTTDNAVNMSDRRSEESLNIRRLFAALGDPSQRSHLNALESLITAQPPNIQAISDFLSENFNVTLDNDEIENFVRVMTTPVDNGNGGQTTVFDLIKSINNSSSWDTDTTRYQQGVQYSDVDLTDYFTASSAEDIYAVVLRMKEGGKGC